MTLTNCFSWSQKGQTSHTVSQSLGFGPVWGPCVERYRARNLISHRDQPPLGKEC